MRLEIEAKTAKPEQLSPSYDRNKICRCTYNSKIKTISSSSSNAS